MASSLSEDEFVRMQTQLLELRTANYQLTDQCTRHERGNAQLRDQLESIDRELHKATKTISKSKKAKEVEILIQENDVLQRKLHNQEEEFRLQNQTLMQELGSLVQVNENLEKENVSLKQGGAPGNKEDQAASNLQDEIRRLQAQNSALQKNLSSCQEKYDQSTIELKQTIQDLEAQCVKLSGKRGTPVGEGSSSEERTADGESDPGVTQDDQTDGMDEQHITVEDAVNENHSSDTNIMDLSGQPNNKNINVEERLKEFNDLKIRLDTEQEEKNLLREQLQNLEKSYKNEVATLKEEVEKLTEKFKKKQESLVQLQEEKEKIYSDLSTKLEELQASKVQDVNRLTEQTAKLQHDLNQCSQVLAEQRETSSRRIQELEQNTTFLKSQVDSASAVKAQQLQEQNQQFGVQLSELKGKVQQLQQKIEDLQLQLQESQKANQSTLEQLYDAQQERDKQIQALQEASKIAEKRKCLLDEMAIKLQKESESHREQTREMEDRSTKEIQDLNAQLEEERSKSCQLDQSMQECDKLQTEVLSLEETKGWLERRLNETEETFQSSKTEFETELQAKSKEHDNSMAEMKAENAVQIQFLKDEIDKLNDEIKEHEQTITKLKQEIKDGVDEKRIHEKKGASMLKDLKRQLQAERKRAEKLQERLQEEMSDKSRQSMEELLKSEPGEYRGDNSSVSSWSASGMGRESMPSPDDESIHSDLAQENTDLVARLAEVQQEKWNLEEKVIHLEASTAAMAEDLLRKTALIEHYAMEGRSDPNQSSPSQEKLTLKRMIDFVKDRGDENMREINRKLQRMLEETLTKNMHLQKDLEMLSQEVVRLSKTAAVPSSEG